MTASAATSPQRSGAQKTRWRPDPVLVTLCVTQLISWGTLYYVLPAVAAEIVADTGWSLVSVMAAFSAGLLVSAGVGVGFGGLLDRFGGRVVMAWSSALATAGVALVATASTFPMFVVAWVVVGVAQAGVLYQAAFTVIGLRYGATAGRPLLVVTLVAGLASTLYVPGATLLAEVVGWRGTYLVLAALLAVVTIPLHALLLPRRDPAPRQVPNGERMGNPVVVRSSRFIRLCLGVTLLSFSVYAVSINLIPLLSERGIDARAAALLLGLVGVGQVVGRVLFTALNRVVPLPLRALLVGAVATLTLVAFALISGPFAVLVLLALLAGAARGALTLVQATAVVERWGTERLGTLNGVFSAPITASIALAPVAGVALAAAVGSFPLAVALLAGVAAVGALLVFERPRRGAHLTEVGRGALGHQGPCADRGDEDWQRQALR
ncbi:MFS transporter [Pseudoclavibacter sp. VKM Ac-2867]|uniref:MFS transporter n=1 Tax=Pseudoclavibacter sp. VKM Ac-2867 TaxID=2783829 RepID=UPI00188C98F9|nr:MFS transporter [Pseudoclavibacter sp. VKM Ac-2867]MBF4457893.1 MFS transporter [Pseudoclavibacter sp. VKM Ac-2867]